MLEPLIEHWEREASRFDAEAEAKQCAQCKVAAETYRAVIADAREALAQPDAVRLKVESDRAGAQLASTMTLTRQ